MVLYTSPFPNSFLSVLHSFSWGLIFPCYWFADRLVASFVPTTYEKRQRADDPCYFQALCIIITTPIYLALLLASLPFALIGFLLWSPLQSARRPYIYSRLEDRSQANGATLLAEWKATGNGKSFCFGSANVCLLPDSLARFNNVFNTQARAREIGRRIRNGASRPQIKIYIDSPTNTSISAASFSSLVSPQGGDSNNRAVNVGIKRTSSLEYKGDNSGSNNSEDSRDAKAGEDLNEGEDNNTCIVRINGEDNGHVSDPEADAICAQANTSGPAEHSLEGERQSPKGQISNHKQKEGDSGSLDSYAASRESLVKVRIGDGTVDQSSINNKLLYKASVMKKTSTRKKKHTDENFDHEISAFFPANLDFLCLQEVFDKRAAEKLKQQLHHYFEYILYDVGVYGCHGCCSFKFVNSGLLFASRYPVMDAAYHCYPNGKGTDSLASKGALFLKVQVGSTPQDQRIVGYISCTHLQALAGDTTVRCEQLDLLQDWLADFRKSTSSSSTANPEELVAFDVICGDLNFDNCSSEDKLEQQHSLFTRYKDPCRLGPGEEKPWAIGTLLDPEGLYEEEVCTPDNLQKVLESEEGRKGYVVYPTSKNHSSSQKGRKASLKGSGRRIDYMLYTEEGIYLEWKVEVEEFNFITQLAGLTDHLPVAMRLMVSTGEEDS
ncbi:sphingomyelin phosphodiesterase 3 [Pelodiscus sinensis]|uniref:Sphingomyelin phosphodiesterase 3 n=1 Tax=Pelodiscus sinensis TaxID=13735 RepID=K7F9N0_PELSI|nr:sphingomyelin phosphodiesterase 3 [Pelodiscus sinensis]XP_006117636.1 sphingomyelin phosphodiesterase 3 [Pelodiscus sinensis]XP_006117638.1 sphingomyelin phosphodiesterase 3 [Pelodiscus sinensis]XP_014426213.1 sphingomyelin phosphodiesterase 3 [Pelodiscus sinensis]|eukprot:XP_006117635.1 sphingomyelin phosphodiesterase 3 [Pelodiscus sinensis]